MWQTFEPGLIKALCILCKYSTSAHVESNFYWRPSLSYNLVLQMEINLLCLTKAFLGCTFKFCTLSDLIYAHEALY